MSSVWLCLIITISGFCCDCICVLLVGFNAIAVVLYLVVLRGGLFGFGS